MISSNKGLAHWRHGRVVSALMLRDLKTRMGASYFGFIAGLILPLGHVGVVLSIYIIMGRRSAIGTDVALFLSSAILPFIIWSYTHQKISQAFIQNISLTYIPIVSLVEIFVARSLVEAINAVIITFVVVICLILMGSDFFIADPPLFVLTLIASFLFGLSTGLLFGLLGLINQVFFMMGFLIIPLFWVLSGVFFVPESLPEVAKYYLSFFTLTHIVDLARISIFPVYVSGFSSMIFVFSTIVCNFFVAGVMYKFGKVVLLKQ